LVLAILSVVARRREHAQRMRKHELEREILHISEREQRRIGQDLHDGLGQRLTSISFQCKALSRLLDSPASERAAEIGTEVRTAISETRALAHALYPAEIDREDLDTALGYLVDSIDRTFEGTCEYRHEWMPDDLDREDALNVYRLVQEALANAVRHAAAATLHVESRRDGTAWVVEVRDDGRGFHPAHPAGRGLGLQIMRYRAELIGGALSVSSRIGSGTTVRCRVPLRRSPGQT
jgi:two-component system CheB/CheR fusion protein